LSLDLDDVFGGIWREQADRVSPGEKHQRSLEARQRHPCNDAGAREPKHQNAAAGAKSVRLK
jgi:hypothetical protein